MENAELASLLRDLENTKESKESGVNKDGSSFGAGAGAGSASGGAGALDGDGGETFTKWRREERVRKTPRLRPINPRNAGRGLSNAWGVRKRTLKK